jgi:hypothetical protein
MALAAPLGGTAAGATAGASRGLAGWQGHRVDAGTTPAATNSQLRGLPDLSNSPPPPPSRHTVSSTLTTRPVRLTAKCEAAATAPPALNATATHQTELMSIECTCSAVVPLHRSSFMQRSTPAAPNHNSNRNSLWQRQQRRAGSYPVAL